MQKLGWRFGLVFLPGLLLLAACSSTASTGANVARGTVTASATVIATNASPAKATETARPSVTATDTPAASTATYTTAASRTPTPAPTGTSTRTPAPAATRTVTAARAPTLLATPAPPPAALSKTELVYIPEGILRMGTKQGEAGDPDEKPQHDVTVYAYNIEKLEVTNAQYQACVVAKACPPPVKPGSYTRPAYFGNPQFADFPVLNITWTGAEAYCKWIGRRLPNEAEWERAARGVDNWRFTFTNILGMPFEWNAIYHGSPLSFCEANCPLSNYWGVVNDGWADTAPVGSFPYDSSKGFGVMDMAGNVSEWTSNWYDPNAYTNGNDVYGPSTPTGAKVFRGGSWADEPRRNADRDSLAPDKASDRIGVRCAQ